MGGRVAFVTGSASGLGRAVALRLAGSGWSVAGFDINQSADLNHAEVGDVADIGAVVAAVDAAASRFGRLDAAISCAGFNRNTLRPVHEIAGPTWSAMLNVNLGGPFNLLRASLPHLMSSRGAVVLVASAVGRAPNPGGSAYGAAKAGVIALAQSVALEYAPFGIRSNSVSPGYMNTAMAAPALNNLTLRSAIDASIPIGRVAEPDEVAAVVEFLVGASTYLTGQDIVVDGGGLLNVYLNGDDVRRLWDRFTQRQKENNDSISQP